MTDEAKKHKLEHYLQAAAMLHRRAELSTIPHEKAQISALAGMAEEMAKLRQSQLEKAQNAAIEAAIAKAKVSRERETVEASDGAEAYAYPHPRGIAWGVNAAQTGVNILRGVRRPDGKDEAEG